MGSHKVPQSSGLAQNNSSLSGPRQLPRPARFHLTICLRGDPSRRVTPDYSIRRHPKSDRDHDRGPDHVTASNSAAEHKPVAVARTLVAVADKPAAAVVAVARTPVAHASGLPAEAEPLRSNSPDRHSKPLIPFAPTIAGP